MPDRRLHDPDHLISPDGNLKEFCYEVMQWDVLQIMEAASAEITYHRIAYRKRTQRNAPRSGTQLRQYCDDLQELIRMLMNARVSPTVRHGLGDDLRPLMTQVLRKVRFNGNVQEVFGTPCDPNGSKGVGHAG